MSNLPWKLWLDYCWKRCCQPASAAAGHCHILSHRQSASYCFVPLLCESLSDLAVALLLAGRKDWYQSEDLLTGQNWTSLTIQLLSYSKTISFGFQISLAHFYLGSRSQHTLRAAQSTESVFLPGFIWCLVLFICVCFSASFKSSSFTFIVSQGFVLLHWILWLFLSILCVL